LPTRWGRSDSCPSSPVRFGIGAGYSSATMHVFAVLFPFLGLYCSPGPPALLGLQGTCIPASPPVCSCRSRVRPQSCHGSWQPYSCLSSSALLFARAHAALSGSSGRVRGAVMCSCTRSSHALDALPIPTAALTHARVVVGPLRPHGVIARTARPARARAQGHKGKGTKSDGTRAMAQRVIAQRVMAQRAMAQRVMAQRMMAQRAMSQGVVELS
jgi:hypothetical protein